MNVPILFLFIALLGLSGKAFGKLCSNMLADDSIAGIFLMLLVNSVTACTFFLISSGFQIHMNGKTLLYSIVFALIAAISMSSLILYKLTNISNVTVISSSCSVIGTAIVGGLIFSEVIGVTHIIRVFVLICAMVCVFLDQRMKAKKPLNENDKKKSLLLPLLILIVITTAVSISNNVILKLFALDTEVTDQNSFFFMTNVFMAGFAIIAFSVICLLRRGEFNRSISLLKPKKIVSMVGNTVSSNISSVIIVILLTKIDVSLYSAITSAVGILTGVVGSFIFRERLGKFSYIAAAIAAVSILI